MNAPAPASPSPRIVSIDALRGLVMAAMIFVNDLSGAGRVVPDWLVHYSDRHAAGSGLTFVDLVFPAFLFLVGMSLPFALGPSLAGRGLLPTVSHILARTAALLLIGVLMVNESPDAARLGWSPALWSTLLYLAAIAACCDLRPSASADPSITRRWRFVSQAVRATGFVGLAFLAASFVGADGHRIVTLAPFALHHDWWGILGLIGWAYLVGAIVFLLFRARTTAVLGCMVLLFCLYAAERAGLFTDCWLAAHVSFGSALGSQAAITVGGLLLATLLLADPSDASLRSRTRFTLLFVAGTAAAALLLAGAYGISKNAATPSWCLWSCAVTATLWLGLHFIADVRPVPVVSLPLARAGQNVLLAYLLSEMLPSLLVCLHLDGAYAALGATLPGALARSLACAAALLAATAALNRSGLRLKL